MRVDVDSGTYTSACDDFYAANRGICQAVTRLSQALESCGSMAGTDSGGREWAAAYDDAAGPLLEAGTELGRALAHMGNLLNAALANHEAADGGARLDGAHRSGSTEPGAGASTRTYDVSLPAPTSAFGGNAAEPDWWHWIAEHLEEFVWPDADTDRPRRAGTAWTTAADTLASYASNCSSAADAIGMNHGPEVADAVGACLDLREHVEEIAAAYREVGAACTDYGTHVDAHRDEVVSILVELLAWTVVDQVAGVVLSFFTFGAAEVAAQLVEAGIMARYAVRIIEVLRRLRALARVAVTAVKSAKLRVAARLGRLKTFVSAPIRRAALAAGQGAARSERRALLDELAAAGIKHDPNAVMTIFRSADGKIVFLERGSNNTGFQHILSHEGEFLAKGIPREQIPTLLEEALTKGKQIGYQGKGFGRPIYEVPFNNTIVRVAITVGSNGYIVGANIR